MKYQRKLHDAFAANVASEAAFDVAFEADEEIKSMQAQVKTLRGALEGIRRTCETAESDSLWPALVDIGDIAKQALLEPQPEGRHQAMNYEPEFGPWKVANHPFKPVCQVFRRSLADPTKVQCFIDPRKGLPALFTRSGAYGWILAQGMAAATKTPQERAADDAAHAAAYAAFKARKP